MRFLFNEIKKWINEYISACKHYVLYRAGRSSANVNLEYKYPTTTSLGAILTISSIIGGGFFGIGPHIGNTVNWIGTFIGSISYPQQALIEKSMVEKNMITKNCFSINEKWRLWHGNGNKSIKEPSYFFLASDENQSLFKYMSVIDFDSNCTFNFVPRGDNAINYVISFDEFYQIVVGDNDYRTISLRASEGVGLPMYPILESFQKKERPRLSSSIKQGSSVVANLTQKKDSNNYKVDLLVKYTTEQGTSILASEDVFSWEFKPSPILQLKSPELSIGLIRGAKDKSSIGVNFISPNPLKEDDEQ